ncbi:MAG: GNAT family N-acetyltransferase [Rhizobiaceae bacterium]|nr:GNAT family N-acetyltransferase [Rhizobiaceae bacterium]MCV0405233.1 GNAT family N-acetyltransferase [Rhizobiaceae bacterium]
MGITIAVETPLQDDVRALIAELNDAITAQEPATPEEFNFRMTVDEMAGSETTVWVARINGEAVGCGALLRHRGGFGEVKRMYVRRSAQGKGVGGLILAEIESLAAAEGLRYLALETGGDGYGAARRVYERAGYRRCGAFGDYPDNPYSTFYRKDLSAAPAVA